jgi:protein O-GlcNAc transferase
MRSLVRGSLVIWFALAGVGAMAQVPEAELIFNGALAHLREGRATLAIKECERAIAKDPKNPYFQKGLGAGYLMLGQYDEAIKAFRRALELNPAYGDVHNDLGTALLLAGHRDEGKKELEDAFTNPMNPTPAVTARNLGQAYLDDRDYDAALRWFQASVERDKRLAEAQVGLADALIGLNRVDDAIKALRAALIPTSDDVRVVAALGEALYRAGRFDEARTRLKKAAELDPSGPAGKRAAELLKNLPAAGPAR